MITAKVRKTFTNLLDNNSVAEFKEFEPRPTFEARIKYGSFHLKYYSMFKDLSRRSIETGFLSDMRRGSNLLTSDSGLKMLEQKSNLAKP